MAIHIMKVPTVYAYYFLDVDGFVERLCENKDKPKLNCNGKCFLATMIKNDKDDSSTNPKSIDWQEITLFFKSHPINYTDLYTTIIEHHYFYLDFKQSWWLKKIFHPPKSSLT